MSLENETEPSPGWTGELGGIHFFTKVLGKVVIRVAPTPTSVPVAISFWDLRLSDSSQPAGWRVCARVCLCVRARARALPGVSESLHLEPLVKQESGSLFGRVRSISCNGRTISGENIYNFLAICQD